MYNWKYHETLKLLTLNVVHAVVLWKTKLCLKDQTNDFTCDTLIHLLYSSSTLKE